MSEVLLLYLGFSGTVVLCTVLPIMYMRREQLRRMREVELHAPLLPKYAHARFHQKNKGVMACVSDLLVVLVFGLVWCLQLD